MDSAVHDRHMLALSYMSFFKATTGLDRAFEVSLLLKGLDGIAETIGGLFLLFVRPQHVTEWVRTLTAHELSHDPHDFFAKHLLHWANDFTKGAAVFAGLYLLSHGVIKLILVVEILREHLWAYLGLIVVTAGFIIYQVVRIIEKPTLSYIALTIFDVVVVALTAKEYSRQHERLAHHLKYEETN
jgi:uncharacterized membrane protein